MKTAASQDEGMGTAACYSTARKHTYHGSQWQLGHRRQRCHGTIPAMLLLSLLLGTGCEIGGSAIMGLALAGLLLSLLRGICCSMAVASSRTWCQLDSC